MVGLSHHLWVAGFRLGPFQLRPDGYDVKSPFDMVSSDESAAYGTSGPAELQTGSLLRVTGLQLHLYNE